ncbi:hypothetical protein OV207_30555 [Corallococcus sp. BB11-1]|uniref:hypothetical protein n=1 Tax=Corallococcus sp. BB11-1 TaxID=2996783 RepID=UPI00226F4336|nr:hypothetical protein [Corallococcus sp. BB11-1]MCY1035822.1 hypothetical protein [Corallococcus sp. BB11-1]
MAPDVPFDAARVDALLATRSGAARPDGVRDWALSQGGVEVAPLHDKGRVVATELRVPLLAQADLIREVLAEAAALAREAKVRLFDPQLGQVLASSDTERVVEQYTRTEQYARTAPRMEITPGLAEAMDAAARYAPKGPGMSLPLKLILFGVGGFAILYFVMTSLLGQLNGE